MYVWVDGIHLIVRLEEDNLCLLVIVGDRADGTKELVAVADGYRESTGSCAEALRDCARYGLRPGPRSQRRRVGILGRTKGRVPGHPGAALLVPQGHQCPVGAAQVRPPRAKAALAQIYNAEDKRPAHAAAKAFAPTPTGLSIELLFGEQRPERSKVDVQVVGGQPKVLPKLNHSFFEEHESRSDLLDLLG